MVGPGEVGEREGEELGEERAVLGKRPSLVSPRPPLSWSPRCCRASILRVSCPMAPRAAAFPVACTILACSANRWSCSEIQNVQDHEEGIRTASNIQD